LLTGTPRGGTTFIASIAHHLGIPLGKKKPRYEDAQLRSLLLGEEMDEDRSKLAKAIRERENRGSLWGWKMPAIVQHLDLVDGLVQQPIYVMIFKDPLSIGLRNLGLGRHDLAGSVRASLIHMRAMVEFVHTTERECILVSFDKADRRPSELIRTLADVAGLKVTDEQVAEIEVRVRADSLRYDRKRPEAVRLARSEEQAILRADRRTARQRRRREARRAQSAPPSNSLIQDAMKPGAISQAISETNASSREERRLARMRRRLEAQTAPPSESLTQDDKLPKGVLLAPSEAPSEATSEVIVARRESAAAARPMEPKAPYREREAPIAPPSASLTQMASGTKKSDR